MVNTKHISEVKKGDNLIINGIVTAASSDAYMTKTDNGKEWNFESDGDYYYAGDFENGIVDIFVEEKNDGCKISVPYVSVWDGGIEIETTAVVDIRTGEITNITSVPEIHGLEICERQYIIMHSEQVDVYENERGYAYWADIENEILGEKNDMIITTKCINGILHEGDLVISSPNDEYACLIGRVTKINLLGTPEHDAETANETDDVHVNFLEFKYSKKHIKEIEERFTELYGEKKYFGDCPLDDVIMSPECLIRITNIDKNCLYYLLQSKYNTACYCYGILSGLTSQIDLEDNPIEIKLVKNEMEMLNHTVLGFKITRIICGRTAEIELTCQELNNAFNFQESKNHFADIEIALEGMENTDELQSHTVEKILADKNLMNKICFDYEENLDDGMVWPEAAIAAIKDNIKNTEYADVSV